MSEDELEEFNRLWSTTARHHDASGFGCAERRVENATGAGPVLALQGKITSSRRRGRRCGEAVCGLPYVSVMVHSDENRASMSEAEREEFNELMEHYGRSRQ